MALSGSVSTTKYDGRYLKLSWTATQSVANNTSTIKWTLSAVGGNSSWYKTGPVTVVMDGATIYSKSTRVQMYTGTIASGTKTITHKSNGSRTFLVDIAAAIYTSAVNCSGSKTFTLDTIPRNPGAPSSVTATAGNGNYVSFGDTMTIRWSGASGVITNYQRAYRWYKDGAWTDWTSNVNVASTATSGSWTINLGTDQLNSGGKIQFRMRAANGNLYSSWVTSNSLTIVGGMFVKVNGAWKQGTAYVKVSGAWKKAQHVYVKVNGAWKESI